MNFDPENKIHFENVDENYEHLDLLDAINMEAFPSVERLPLKALAAINDVQQLRLKAVVDGEVPVGFMIWFELGEGFNYLAYLAIDPQYRNRKYGSKTLNHIFDDVLAGEVNFGAIEALNPNADNYEQRLARKRLYEKLGFIILDNVIETPKNGSYQLLYHGPETKEEVLMDKLNKIMELIKKLFNS